MNSENFQRLIDLLEEDRFGYCQQYYVHRSCGTPACIAGHATWLYCKEDKEAYGLCGSQDMVFEARKFLGISPEVAISRLFSPNPLLDVLVEREESHLDRDTIKKRYGRENFKPTVEDAVKVLKHLEATGEVDWGVCLEIT